MPLYRVFEGLQGCSDKLCWTVGTTCDIHAGWHVRPVDHVPVVRNFISVVTNACSVNDPRTSSRSGPPRTT